MTAGGLRRGVYDCNIYVQALISPYGPSARCVEKATAREVALFASPYVLDEIRESHFKIPRKYGVTAERAAALAEVIAVAATIVADVPATFSYARDPDDAHYVNLAIAARAELIVSRDRDLLDLTDVATSVGADFKRRFPGLRVIDPVEFLRELDGDRDG